MSDPKDFLTRWSRRKREAAGDDTDAAAVRIAPAAEDNAADPVEAAEFDLASLPPIDSIGAGSDIRAFLQRGVPAGLTRAALRRAWSSDPAIRNFVGLSENAWDFNAPDSMPGFGPLVPEEIRRLAGEFFGEPGAAETAGDATPDRTPLVQSASASRESALAPPHEMPTGEGEAKPAQVHGLKKPEDDRDAAPAEGQFKVDIAAQYQEKKPEYDPGSLAPRHGGALPK